ncbi:MAG: hypothetical protein ACREQ5_14585, partial [Candidatus Dormibacteria bacterium]
MKTYFIDFETYFSDEFSLKNLSIQEYILDDRLKIHGCGIAGINLPPIWVNSKNCKAVLEAIIPENIVVCHNASFDCAI